MFQYTLMRTKRRTLAIYVMPDARIEVHAPYRCPVCDIEAFLEQKTEWIKRKQNEAAQVYYNTDLPLNEDSTLPYLGKELTVYKSDDRCFFNGEAFIVPKWMIEKDADIDKSRDIIVEMYKSLTFALVKERVKFYSNATGLKPAKVKVTKAVKQWGSCSGKGNLNFSWMLAAAPMEALDYVVVHELCHLSQHNHSEKFWKLVSSVLPNYKVRQNLLRSIGRRMSRL